MADALLMVFTHELPSWAPRAALDDMVAQGLGPLVTALERDARRRVALHLGGHLLDGLARHHEGELLRLRALVEGGRVEILGGLFYGGPLALLPERDVRCQVQMAGEFWESFVGRAPRGFWLAGGLWPEELPRLLEQTGLDFGLLARGGLAGCDPEGAAVASVRRGDQRLAAILVDSALSAAFGREPADAWLAQARRAARAHGGATAVQLDIMRLGLGGPSPPVEQIWAALPESLAPALPSAYLAAYAAPAPVAACRPPLTPVVGGPDGALVARMLRASARLRRAIGLMEDEEREEQWSDGLATAQRLVFAAQAPDAYPPHALGGRVPAVAREARRAAWRRLVEAEALIDRTLSAAAGGGAPAPPGIEHFDLDGDGQPEIWLGSEAVGLWVEGDGPSLDPGLWLRALEARSVGREIFAELAPPAGPMGLWQGWAEAGGLAEVPAPRWRAPPADDAAADVRAWGAVSCASLVDGAGATRHGRRRVRLARRAAEVELAIEVDAGAPLAVWLRLPWAGEAVGARVDGRPLSAGETAREVGRLALGEGGEVALAMTFAPPVAVSAVPAHGPTPGHIAVSTAPSPTGALSVRLVVEVCGPEAG